MKEFIANVLGGGALLVLILLMWALSPFEITIK